jgi:septation ring formation regulator EzrA
MPNLLLLVKTLSVTTNRLSTRAGFSYDAESGVVCRLVGCVPFIEVNMRKFVLTVMLLVAPFGLSSCDKAYIATMEKMGYAKRDILSSRVKSARDAQEDAKKDIQSTLDQFGKVVSYEGGDLEATYKKLSGELETSEDSAKAVRKRIEDVESVADALFSEWEQELSQYSSADLRRKSQAKLTQTKSRYKDMLAAMKRAEQRIEPVLRPLRDQVLYLKHNLNARALAAIKGELIKVDAQVDQLVKDMNRSIAEADKFIQSMEKESD